MQTSRRARDAVDSRLGVDAAQVDVAGIGEVDVDQVAAEAVRVALDRVRRDANLSRR